MVVREKRKTHVHRITQAEATIRPEKTNTYQGLFSQAGTQGNYKDSCIHFQGV